MLKDALGSYRGSLDDLDRAVREAPRNAEAYYDRANVKSRNGNNAGAAGDYTIALELGLRMRERFLALGNRGMARVALGDVGGALSDFSEIVDASPKNRSILRTALLNRMVLRKRIGDFEGADLDYRRALSITIKKKGE
ncbi:hypothetical protein CHL67_09355 [Prosthecochloris sp. GSB1]|uniref:tetratricopeptide repeat protein n=1 Tax=Prosthecochloris sp. GSB1 TaxID=281093 RepID=UPI000B8CD782|nr:tetratricopeptide repeat protein [Prosthecochloris sp. GSB1]ASQ91094.1 hypothetical protein CHL67_09355 [Prosthecochloris sp. GSB1]